MNFELIHVLETESSFSTIDTFFMREAVVHYENEYK